MIDHLMIRVRDYKRSESFYDAVLATLGYHRVLTFPHGAGYGMTKPYFWIGAGADPQSRTHIAFAAKDRVSVDKFHQVALENGAKDDGSPGLRDQYHPNYYGSFVIDPDGHNIEAVCHDPMPGKSTKTKKTTPSRSRATVKPAKKAKPAPARKRK